MNIGTSEVYLRDEGTLDTVFTVDGCRHAFSQELAAGYRDAKTGALTKLGFQALANMAADDHIESCC